MESFSAVLGGQRGDRAKIDPTKLGARVEEFCSQAPEVRRLLSALSALAHGRLRGADSDFKPSGRHAYLYTEVIWCMNQIDDRHRQLAQHRAELATLQSVDPVLHLVIAPPAARCFAGGGPLDQIYSHYAVEVLLDRPVDASFPWAPFDVSKTVLDENGNRIRYLFDPLAEFYLVEPPSGDLSAATDGMLPPEEFEVRNAFAEVRACIARLESMSPLYRVLRTRNYRQAKVAAEEKQEALARLVDRSALHRAAILRMANALSARGTGCR